TSASRVSRAPAVSRAAASARTTSCSPRRATRRTERGASASTATWTRPSGWSPPRRSPTTCSASRARGPCWSTRAGGSPSRSVPAGRWAGLTFGLSVYVDATRDRELWLANVPFFDSLSFTFLCYLGYALAIFLSAPLVCGGGDFQVADTRAVRTSWRVLVTGAFLTTLLDL